MLSSHSIWSRWTTRGGTPILEDGGERPLYWPPFWHFPIPLDLFLCPIRLYWPCLSAEEICMSLSYLVPEINWPKVGLFFHKNLSFWHFWSNLYQFSPWFSILLTPFFIVIRSFWPRFLQNCRSCWVHFLSCAGPHYRKFGEVPPRGLALPLFMVSLNCITHFWSISTWSSCTSTYQYIWFLAIWSPQCQLNLAHPLSCRWTNWLNSRST